LCALHSCPTRRSSDLQGQLYISRVAFRISELHSPEPDLAFVKKDRLMHRKRGHFDGPPDVAFEIVSPDSVDRDYTKKRKQYEDRSEEHTSELQSLAYL